MAPPKFYMRCPHCGDSWKHPNKKHLAVYPDGGYHCFRCKAHGTLSMAEMLHLGFNQAALATEPHGGVEPFVHGSKNVEVEELKGLGPLKRYSAVQRRYVLHEESLPGPIEVFEARGHRGNVTGYHLRPSWSKLDTRSMGSMLLGYSGPRLSTIRKPLRIVEGPYDAIYPNDVCVWGMPNRKQLAELKFVPLLLCPDGDVWDDWTKYIAWIRPFIQSKSFVVGAEFLPPDTDPDEQDARSRIKLSTAQLFGPYWRRNAYDRPTKPRDLVV